MRYAVFIKNHKLKPGSKASEITYWTGAFNPSGFPKVSTDKRWSAKFKTAREAYAEAGQYKSLWTFRVGKL